MPKTRVCITLGCCLFALAAVALAQSTRKPGLWEMTSNITWQQSPMPPGAQAPAGSPFAGGPRTTQVCLTQAMIDKYGAPAPQMRGCHLTNVAVKATSMTASMVCSGAFNGTGTVESSWSDPNHAKGNVHFSGTFQMGQRIAPIEFTTDSTSAYKGPDCGSVQPMPMPNN